MKSLSLNFKILSHALPVLVALLFKTMLPGKSKLFKFNIIFKCCHSRFASMFYYETFRTS